MGSDDYESGFDDAADDVTDDHHSGDIFFPAHSVSASQLKAADFVSIAGESKEQRRIRLVPGPEPVPFRFVVRCYPSSWNRSRPFPWICLFLQLPDSE